MRTTQTPRWINCQRSGNRLLPALVISALIHTSIDCCQAGPTNIIWQAQISGSSAIQESNSEARPVRKNAKFKTADFFRMLGLSGTGDRKSDQVLALNFDLVQTNLTLSIYSKSVLTNVYLLSTNEVTTFVADDARFTFTTEAVLGTNVSSSANWNGGFFRIAGQGRFLRGTPTGIRANITGYMVDNRPGDVNGTTALVTRAKLTIRNAPLRVQPQTP